MVRVRTTIGMPRMKLGRCRMLTIVMMLAVAFSYPRV